MPRHSKSPLPHFKFKLTNSKEKQQYEMPARLTEIKADMKKDKAKFRTIQSKLASERPPSAISKAHVNTGKV
jgi:hypothetical protein